MSDLALLVRSLAVLLLAVLSAVIVFRFPSSCNDVPYGVPSADPAKHFDTSPSLLQKKDEISVARRADSSTVVVERMAVHKADRYAGTVTVQARDTVIVALGVRALGPAWLYEFGARRADAFAIDVLPRLRAEDVDVLTMTQRLPLLALEAEPQFGLGVGSQGPVLVLAVTGLRVSGFHFGAFSAIGSGHLSAGPYASIKPRPGWSFGIGLDVGCGEPVASLTLTL